MKYGLLVTTPAEDQLTKNIGDYIQTVAALQYHPQNDIYIKREYISKYQDEKNEETKIILNSWWMWHPENWPPRSELICLPISMHISPSVSEKMLTGEGLEWFKRNEPIGCRDLPTLKILQEHGIEAYFSACITLTLYKDYKPINDSYRKGICFVDPYVPRQKHLSTHMKVFLHFLKNPITILKLSKHSFFEEGQTYNGIYKATIITKPRILYFASIFHLQYSKKFTDEVLLNAEYIHHISDVSEIKDDVLLLNQAKSLIKKYQSKKMVITSRIHCALPCLSMNTPVVFVEHKDIVGGSWNANRLGGLIDFFRIMKVSLNGIETVDPILKSVDKMSIGFSFKNKETWRPYAEKLEEAVMNFYK